MLDLVKGIRHFQKQVFPQQEELMQSLAEGQHPSALFITCSDSRVTPDLLTHSGPGDMFVLRNAGAMVPPSGASDGGEAASVEFAVTLLEVPEIIVCGHSHCGAMTALLNPERVNSLTSLRKWLKHAETTRRIMDLNYTDLTDPGQRLNIAIQEHVLVQLKNLETHPCVAAALVKGKLRLSGWVYKFETGEVYVFNPKIRRFEQLVKDGPEPVEGDGPEHRPQLEPSPEFSPLDAI